MKKTCSFLLASMMLFLTACSPSEPITSTQSQNNVIVQTVNQTGETIDLEVPYSPQRVAILDMASLDLFDTLGIGDRVVGSASTTLDYLQEYMNPTSIADLGTIKEADLEAVMACDPDLIFIGSRLASSYDALSEIAPVIMLSSDYEIGVVDRVRANVELVSKIFGLEQKAEEQMAEFDTRIQKLQNVANGQSAIVGMCSSGSFHVLGTNGRCSIISREIGFQNIGTDSKTEGSPHGNEASFELIADKNPDYIFVLDRDAAIGTGGATTAQQIMDNELIQKTDAYKNGTLIYLDHPTVWYTAEGGLTALDLMLSDLEASLLSPDALTSSLS